MEEKKGRLSSRWQSAYRRTSIQMILSASSLYALNRPGTWWD